MIGMASPYQILDWYGGRHTCHTASGALQKAYMLTLASVVVLSPASADPILDCRVLRRVIYDRFIGLLYLMANLRLASQIIRSIICT